MCINYCILALDSRFLIIPDLKLIRIIEIYVAQHGLHLPFNVNSHTKFVNIETCGLQIIGQSGRTRGYPYPCSSPNVRLGTFQQLYSVHLPRILSGHLHHLISIPRTIGLFTTTRTIGNIGNKFSSPWDHGAVTNG